MSSKSQNIATEIIDLVFENNALIFKEEYNNACIALEGSGNEIVEINSTAFIEWLADLCYENLEGYVPSTAIEKQVVKVLQAKARRGGERYNLEINIAKNNTAILYDLGKGVVKITDKNWSVVDNPPIVFRKPYGQLQQSKPKRGGDVKELLKFFNITNESEQLLILCYIITLFVPGILYPVLILHGTQGAGKSFLMEIMKSLVDHTELEKGLNTPKDEQDFALHAMHNYLLFYDNLSGVKEQFSDALCRAVTGATFTTRKLYSNNEVFTVKFNRPVILNGLNQIVSKSDLLDRSLVMQLERVSDEKRKEPALLKAEFEELKPYILGSIFDAIIKAQSKFSVVSQYRGLSRMTEFDHWACAIAEVLGYGQDKFRQARLDNIQMQHGYAIEASPSGTAIMEFMRDKEEWVGEPAELYGLLEPHWARLHLEKPKDAPRLGKAVNTLVPNLRGRGIITTRPPRGDVRLIKFVNIAKTTDGSDGTDSSDSKNGED